MVLGTFGEHIYSECDGSGYIISVFPDSQDHLRGVLGIKIDVGHGISILIPSNQFFHVS